MSLPNTTAHISTSKVSQSTIAEQQQDESHTDTELELTPLQELETTIDRFKQQLSEDIDPLVISLFCHSPRKEL